MNTLDKVNAMFDKPIAHRIEKQLNNGNAEYVITELNNEYYRLIDWCDDNRNNELWWLIKCRANDIQELVIDIYREYSLVQYS